MHPLFLYWKHGSVCEPEKNQVQNMDLKKSGCKKQGHCYSNFFLNSNDPVPDPKKMSGRPDKLEKWVQIDWTSNRSSWIINLGFSILSNHIFCVWIQLYKVVTSILLWVKTNSYLCSIRHSLAHPNYAIFEVRMTKNRLTWKKSFTFH